VTTPRALLSPSALTRAELLGPAALQWSADLDDLVTEVEQRWAITVGEPFPSANEGLVARATTADGTEAVLKLTAPTPWTDHQFDLLEQADGRGYARVLAVDHEQRAVLLEALGEPLGGLGWARGRGRRALVANLRR
jgi:streptomycin 6-kinase